MVSAWSRSRGRAFPSLRSSPELNIEFEHAETKCPVLGFGLTHDEAPEMPLILRENIP
jgi:hypothetical protein